MADGFRIHVGGGPELRRDLRAIERDLPKRVLPAAHRRIGMMIEPVARRLSPKGATGRLERSHRVLASQRRAAVAAGTASVFYGRVLFFGTTGPRRTRRGANRGQIAENRWLDRARDIVGEARIVNAYDQELGRILDQHGMR